MRNPETQQDLYAVRTKAIQDFAALIYIKS